MIRRFAEDERGSIFTIVALTLPVLLVLGAFVIDTGNWWTHKRHLQNQVDAGALAAGANYVLPDCESDTNLQNQIANEALVYAGSNRKLLTSPADTRTPFNTQLSGSNVDVVVNALDYPDKGGTDFDDGGSSCFSHPEGGPGATQGASKGLWTDVKATESNPPFLIPFAGVFAPTIRAHARVAIKKATIFSGTLPLAIPDVNPTLVKATLVNECVPTSDPGYVIQEITLTRPDPAQPELWSGSTPAAVTLPGGGSACTGADTRNGKVGVRVLVSNAENDACGEELVRCYEIGSANGVYLARLWSAPAPPQDQPGNWLAPNPPTASFLPYVSDVHLNLNPGCFGYFTAIDCTSPTPGQAQISVQVVRGTGPNSFAVGEFNEMQASTPIGNVNLTDASGTGLFTGSIPLAPQGAYKGGPFPIQINWSWRMPGSTPWRGLTCPNECKLSGRTFGTVHRGYRATPNLSGPIRDIQLTETNTGLLVDSRAAGYTNRLTVTMHLDGMLQPQDEPSDPTVALRVVSGTGANTQSLDCDPTVTNMEDEIAVGCTKLFKINDGTDAEWNPCDARYNWQGGGVGYGDPPGEPYQCVHKGPGTNMSGFGGGLQKRTGNISTCVHPNHWPRIGSGSPDDPMLNKSDPRAVKLFLVEYNSFSDSDVKDFPIINVGLFYITGWNATGSNTNPCIGAGDDDTAPGALIGHFFQRVGINDDELIPEDEACNPHAVTPCVAVLVD